MAPCNSADYPGFILFYFYFSYLNLGARAGFALANCNWLGRTIAFYQVFFQQGREALGKWCIGTQKGHPSPPQDSRDGFFVVQCPGLIFLAVRRSGPATFGEHVLRLFGLYPSSLSKFVGFVSLSGKALLVSISAAILFLRSWHVYVSLKFEFRGKSCVETEHGCENGISSTLYITIVHRVNLNKLSRNLVGAFRTTTTNCRVSFIDLYLVFPRNFRIVFLPHTNTVILLEPQCGTITEPGLPVGQACHLEH